MLHITSQTGPSERFHRTVSSFGFISVHVLLAPPACRIEEKKLLSYSAGAYSASFRASPSELGLLSSLFLSAPPFIHSAPLFSALVLYVGRVRVQCKRPSCTAAQPEARRGAEIKHLQTR